MFTTTNEIALELIEAHKEMNEKAIQSAIEWDVKKENTFIDAMLNIEDKLAEMLNIDSFTLGQALTSM